ncbi:YxD-tail cyclophane-containing RiPP peptide [Streptomyces sp. NPDC000878]
MSNPATGEPTGWDEPLPDLTKVVWEELPEGNGHSVLTEVLAMLAKRPARTVAYYDDAP